MSAEEPAVSFRELLAYTDYLADRWLKYFRQHPEALEINIGGKTGSVRQLVNHIFQAEQFFADRLLDRPGSASKLGAPGLEDLERLHQEAQAQLVGYLASAGDEELRHLQPFGPTKVSNRKILTQTALHGVHHWAQIAMEVRQAGLPTDKPQDIIITAVME
jgi:uncharacterized damage-inducible protein DinB